MLNHAAEDNLFQHKHIIPLGINFDHYEHRHLLNISALPNVENCILRHGSIMKRRGKSMIFDFAGPQSESTGGPIYPAGVPGTIIRGFFADEQWAYIFTGIEDAPNNAQTGKAAQTGRLYRWNYIADYTDENFIMQNITPDLYGLGVGLSDHYRWHCIRHYDNNTGEKQIICANGWDYIIKIVDGIATSLIPASEIANGNMINGKYLASFYDAVYVAYMTDDGAMLLLFENGGYFGSTTDPGIQTGDIIAGAQSGAYCVVNTVTVSSGSWATGTAAGDFTFSVKVGNFTPGETLICNRGSEVDQDVAITSDGTISDPFAVQWSAPGNSADFKGEDAIYNYFIRPEDGLEISGLAKITNSNGDDMLLLGKGSTRTQNQLWTVQRYDVCNMLNPVRGFSNHWGVAALGPGKVYFNDKGRILDLAGENISVPIELYLKSADVGQWRISAVDYEYEDKVVFSSGKYLFTWDERQKTWSIDKYDFDIEVLWAMSAGSPIKSMLGIMAKHSILSVAEEDIISDLIFSYNKSQLAIYNHLADDDGLPITSFFETPTVPVSGDPLLRARMGYIELAGRPMGTNSVFTIYGSFTDAPYPGQWEEIGTITLNQDGYGCLWFKARSRWASFKVVESSTYSFELFHIAIGWQPSSYR